MLQTREEEIQKRSPSKDEQDTSKKPKSTLLTKATSTLAIQFHNYTKRDGKSNSEKVKRHPKPTAPLPFPTPRPFETQAQTSCG